VIISTCGAAGALGTILDSKHPREAFRPNNISDQNYPPLPPKKCQGQNQPLLGLSFDVVIVDEASQVS
jgi:hypothetical protein